jgi:3-hydroxypropanoate dehydrogenase
MTAPVTVIIAYDLLFYGEAPEAFSTQPWRSRPNATPHSRAYLIIAARALDLDCGPMSGFDNARLDDEFFGAGKECEGCEQEFFPAAHVKSVQLGLRRCFKAVCSRAPS